MKKLIAACAALGMVTGTAQAADGDPVVFKPAGDWTADYGDDYCRLVRTFSDGTNQITLGLERMQPMSLVKIMLLGNGIKLYRRADTIGYNYSPSGDSRTSQLLRSDTTDGQQMLIIDGANIGPMPSLPGFGVPRRQFARVPGGPPPSAPSEAGPAPAPGTPLYLPASETEYAAGIKGLMLTEGTLDPVSFETGSFKGVIGALQACTYDLLTYWGVDGEKHKTLSRTVVPQSGNVLPQGTIGFQDFAKLAGGLNMVRVMIDANGTPTECKIHFASLDESTNAKICSHLMKAKFLPALDSAGQPMASYWINSPFFLFGPPPGG